MDTRGKERQAKEGKRCYLFLASGKFDRMPVVVVEVSARYGQRLLEHLTLDVELE